MLANENKIDRWSVGYSNDKGEKFNGKLTVTNKRIIYQALLDVSAKGILKESILNVNGYLEYLTDNYIIIPKERIKDVCVEKSFFSKKVIITLDDNCKHIFNYGIYNVDSIAKAIHVKY